MNTQRGVLLPATAVTAAVLLAGACGGTANGSGGQPPNADTCVHVVDEDTVIGVSPRPSTCPCAG